MSMNGADNLVFLDESGQGAIEHTMQYHDFIVHSAGWTDNSYDLPGRNDCGTLCEVSGGHSNTNLVQ